LKRKGFVLLLIAGLVAGSASAQLGSGIVYDPTNYQNALLRYYQLRQHLLQLEKTYIQVVTQYNLALRMSQSIQNMPARYRALFSQWKSGSALNTFGNTSGWITGVNTGNVGGGYRQSTTELSLYDPGHLSAMDPFELSRVKSQYASVQLADGANETAMATIGSIRGSASQVQTQIGNLESDSLSNDPDLNSEVSVLNKINAANILTLRSLQDSNKLLASLLEVQTVLAKQQREATTNTINSDIARRQSAAGNIAQVTTTLTNSLENFRMP
jgi:hypothetical protein